MARASIKSLLGTLTTIAGIVAALSLGLLSLIVVFDVVSRNLGLVNLPWLNELTEYLITISTFFGAPWVLRHRAHVNIDIVIMLVSKRTAHLMMKGADLLGAAISAVIGWLAVKTAVDSYQTGAIVFKTMVFPEWYLMIPMIWCFSLCCLLFCVNFFEGQDQA